MFGYVSFLPFCRNIMKRCLLILILQGPSMKFLLAIILSTSCLIFNAQDVKVLQSVYDNIGVSGSFGAVGTFYNVNGIEARRDPFFWQTNASLNISAKGVSIPFSATFSQQQRSFTQPFNQFGLSPAFKSFKTHLGFRSMRFSEFSLNGNQFLGVGVEYAPSKGLVSAKALVGRFAKAVDGYYSDGLVIGTPSYERWGYGANVTIGTQANNLGIVFFRAKDMESSLTNFQNDATIKPGQNLVFGFNTKQKIAKHWTFDAEIDWSAYTNDTRLEPAVLEGYSYINNLGSLFEANTSSSLNKALRANLNYKNKKFTTKLGYRRIDPGYKTMGSVYLNNDFEDVTAKFSFKFFQNKIGLSTSGGLQRNNLDDSKLAEMLRLIGSISASIVPNEKWNFALNYANYNTQTRMSLISTSIAEDTLRYAQITSNASVRATRNLVIGNNRGSIFGMANVQEAKINGQVNTEFYGANLGGNYSFTQQKLILALSVSANKNKTPTTEITAFGPNLSVGKAFSKNKLKLTAAGSYLKSLSFNTNAGVIINAKIGAKYALNKAHSFFVNSSWAKRSDPTKNYTEMITTIGYKYNFKKG